MSVEYISFTHKICPVCKHSIGYHAHRRIFGGDVVAYYEGQPTFFSVIMGICRPDGEDDWFCECDYYFDCISEER